MTEKGFTLDFTDFDKGFQKIVAGAPEEGAKGLFAAGNELLRDAVEEDPKAPFDKGDLRGSRQVNKAKVSKDQIETEAGFNIEYAARWHELSPAEDSRINWSLPGSGRKYLESKMTRNMNRYMEVIRRFVEKALGGKT